MNRIERWRWWILGGAVGLLLVLFAAPSTGWIVRAHLRLWGYPCSGPALLADLGIRDIPLWGEAPRLDPSQTEARDREIAARHPDDYPINLACALKHGRPKTNEEASAAGHITDREARLAPLAARFPNTPALYADILRMACMRPMCSGRDENYLLTGDSVPPKSQSGGRSPLTDQQFAVFEDAAATGELLDPDNAYFPCMRAVGYYGVGRDDEATAALLRAGSKGSWNDYSGLEARGDWSLLQETQGDRSSLPHLAYYAAVLFPHYASIRSMSRVATYKAIVAEQAGRKEEGLGIRTAELRIASLMRAQSTSVIGSLVGIAIAHVAISRPGGAPPVRHKEQSGAEDPAVITARMLEREQTYTRYVANLGHAQEASWTEREMHACLAARSIPQRAMKEDLWLVSVQRTTAWGLASNAVFMCMLWMLMAAGLAAVASRGRRIRAGLPMTRGGKVGAVVGVLLAVACAVAAIALPMSDASMVAVGLLPAVTLALIARARRASALWAAIAGAALTTATVTSAGIVCFLATRSSLSLAIGLAKVIANLTAGGPDPTRSIAPVALLASFLPLLIVPLTAMCIAIVSWRCRVPVSVGLVRGFRGLGVPLACVLVLPYGFLVANQARAEAWSNIDIERRWQHEGKYMAEMIGVEWPGVTR